MYLKSDNIFNGVSQSFNMTPIIDMVFLLIIFFSLVSRFIGAENFDLTVPDQCSFAESKQDNPAQLTTVTVLKNKDDVEYAVGSKKITSPDRHQAADKIAQLLDVQLKNLPPSDRIVVLRIDKDVPYADAQFALAGIAKSSASDIQLAVLKNRSKP